MSLLSIPAQLRSFYALWPLHTWPPIHPSHNPKSLTHPTLWIHPPRDSVLLLSADVECLKWQAYLALRGLERVSVRWDVSPDGGVDGRLPCLHVTRSGEDGEELLAAHMIAEWVDKTLGIELGAGKFDGYRDEVARDESHAWVALLEGKVHAALLLSQPQPSLLSTLLALSDPSPTPNLTTLLTPPAPSLSGISSLFPPYGTRISPSTIDLQFKDAIASLSERLGTDRWFLASESPTALDALSFAYLHTILHTPDPNPIRIEVTRRVNLVAWERRVRAQVAGSFVAGNRTRAVID